MKYIIEIKPEYEGTTKGIIVLGIKNNCLCVDELAIEELEELNSDYINEHFGDLQDTAYQRGLEDGKAVNDKGCEGCMYQDRGSVGTPCIYCSNNFRSQWMAKQTDDKIEVGDEVEWDGDKYIVTYLNKGINTGEVQDYDMMGADGSVVDHVSKCAITKTGRHFDIASILEEMRND